MTAPLPPAAAAQAAPAASAVWPAGVAADLPLLGCDFSSRPTPKKPITLATGHCARGVLRLTGLERWPHLDDWARRLAQSEWVGGFDLPFGLPRPLVAHWQWPTDWRACMARYAAQDRATLRQMFKAHCDARPPGQKMAHRATDGPAGASPSMKWVNPPVAWMMHAGLPPLMALETWFPAHEPLPVAPNAATPRRIALEAYPGLLARALLARSGVPQGARASYKSDDPQRHTPDRLLARKSMLTLLEQGQNPLAIRLKLSPAQADALAADPSGDALDAVLCLMQVAWAVQQAPGGDGPVCPGANAPAQRHGVECRAFGLPPGVDPLEGWILTA